jgi:hypothetical protein
MATGRNPLRPPQSTEDWSLGAVLAEREIDERTCLLLIRADVALGPSLAFERRVLGLRLVGFTTIAVDVGDGGHVISGLLSVTDVSRLLEVQRLLLSGFPRSGSAVSTVSARGKAA